MTTPAGVRWVAAVIVTVAAVVFTDAGNSQTPETVTIRGHVFPLRTYGSRGGIPVIVSSGDGGWVHLAPHVAEALAARGYFVVGFDVRAYLETFTAGTSTLRSEDEPGDYKALVDVAARGATEKPILIGVSEGAGLSVLAATDPRTKSAIAGVIGLGLPDLNELGWRWKDSVIYLTHGVPREPLFSVSAFVDRVAPLPIAEIHSTHDEFVPVEQVRQLFERAREPKKLWIVEASDHRFSDNLSEFDRRLLEAVTWITSNAAR
jgi:alpha-beta hydrolase superfamily lysophospholipase